MKIAILQARTTSSRLPGKVLKPILGVPMIFCQIERLSRSKQIDKLVIATSVDASNDLLAKSCAERNIACSRGSLDDVLDRFYQIALSFKPQHVIRLTGDFPLADPHLIDQVIQFYLNGNYDYASNTIAPTYPDGLDVEVFSFKCLQEAWKEAELISEREHVTPFIYKHPERYKLGDFRNSEDLSKLRWTVDEPADFEFVTKIYETLYPRNPQFTTEDILQFLETHTDILKLNSQFKRNEGYAKSLAQDRKVQPS